VRRSSLSSSGWRPSLSSRSGAAELVGVAAELELEVGGDEARRGGGSSSSWWRQGSPGGGACQAALGVAWMDGGRIYEPLLGTMLWMEER
jgi:hypothetical protein